MDTLFQLGTVGFRQIGKLCVRPDHRLDSGAAIIVTRIRYAIKTAPVIIISFFTSLTSLVVFPILLYIIPIFALCL